MLPEATELVVQGEDALHSVLKLQTSNFKLQTSNLKLLYIPQYLQHTLRRLLLGIDPIYQFAVLIVAHNHVFG